MKQLDLTAVTLVCCENFQIEKAKGLIADMERLAKFGDVRHITTHKTLTQFQEAEFTLGLDCKTSHILTIHLDGFIIDPDVWDPKWLAYDYIGALWPPGHLQNFNPAWTHRVGNSGFSLRSRRLNNRAHSLMNHYKVFDLLVGQVARRGLEHEGFKFAPVEEAAKFSVEIPCPETPARTFGFHGKWPLVANTPHYYQIGDSARGVALRAVSSKRVVLLTAHGPENSRTKFAKETQLDAERHEVKILHRDATEIGDKLGRYYVKDILDFSLMLSGDVFCYTNNDVALVPEWRNIILPAVEDIGCAFSQRLDVLKFDNKLTLADINQPGQTPYIGTDLFAFTPAWWAEHRDNFPLKMILGAEGWDAVLTWLMCQSGARRGPTVCYHEKHSNWWSDPAKLKHDPAAVANQVAQMQWAIKNKLQHLLGGPNGYIWKEGIFCLDT